MSTSSTPRRTAGQFVQHHLAIARRELADPHSREWFHLALRLWLVFSVVVTIKTFVSPEKHTVYTIFDLASVNWWRGESIYVANHMTTGFRYTPTFAVALTPMAMLPRAIGGTLWTLANVWMLYGALRMFARDMLGGWWTRRREAVLLLIALVLSIRGFWAAQSNALLLALVLLAGSMILRQAWWRAVLCLALPVYIKIWPIAAALVLVACWPRQLSWRWLAIMAVLAVVPFATQRPAYVAGQYQSFGELLMGPCQERWSAFRDAWTIWEAIGTPDPRVFRILQLLAAGGVLAGCLWKRLSGAPTERVVLAAVALWPAWQLLFGPASERNTYGLLAPAMALALVESWRSRRGLWLACLALACFLIGSGGIERSLVKYASAAQAILPLGVVVYLLWFLYYGWREPTTPASDERETAAPKHVLRPHIAAATATAAAPTASTTEGA
ncbi:MAG: glycosyltransferase family 87 protein [Pirellulales bacterium]